ncbi:MAG: hypothetical protein FWC20_09025 [Oscillospiraceae bacterium]|nr:hypothetical protein [Oscillospiraceae bacterium]MCL2279531.1 hypothetical protein [Oscillospiraceae bacterium]
MKKKVAAAIYCRLAVDYDRNFVSQEAELRIYTEENSYNNVSVNSDVWHDGSMLDHNAKCLFKADSFATGRVLVRDITRILQCP